MCLVVLQISCFCSLSVCLFLSKLDGALCASFLVVLSRPILSCPLLVTKNFRLLFCLFWPFCCCLRKFLLLLFSLRAHLCVGTLLLACSPACTRGPNKQPKNFAALFVPFVSSLFRVVIFCKILFSSLCSLLRLFLSLLSFEKSSVPLSGPTCILAPCWVKSSLPKNLGALLILVSYSLLPVTNRANCRLAQVCTFLCRLVQALVRAVIVAV